MEKDKLQIATALLSDAIVGFFIGNSPETTINLAYAVLTTIRDLKTNLVTLNEISNYELSSELAKINKTLHFEKDLRNKGIIRKSFEEANPSVIDLATFTKHAKQDPFLTETFLLPQAVDALACAAQDYFKLVRVMSEKGLIGFHPAGRIDYEQGKKSMRITELGEYLNLFMDHYDSTLSNFKENGDALNFENNILKLNNDIFILIYARGLHTPPPIPEYFMILSRPERFEDTFILRH